MLNLTFCTLATTTITNLLLDGVSNAVTVQTLTSHFYVLSIHGRRRYIWYQYNTQLWSIDRISILSSHFIRFISILLHTHKDTVLNVQLLYLANRLGYLH